MKKLLSLLLVLPLVFSALPCAVNAAKEPPSCPAQAAILIEKEDGKVLFSKNENDPLPLASTTKIMTALIVIERCHPEETVTIKKQAVGTGGSSAYLRAGEQLTVLDLLYCLMLRSANDAAVALALHTAGSIDGFARLMNEKAEALGMNNSHFVNPHGLDEEQHYASAADLATLTAHALENELFARIVSTRSMTVGEGENARSLTNHNRLLSSLDGCIGVKTGYTIRSGRCLVSACKRGETVLICVTINCRPDWDCHSDLYEYGFSTVKRTVFEGYRADLPVAGSTLRVHVASENYSLLTSPEGRLSFVPLCPSFLFPPLSCGQKVGQINVVLNGNVIDVIPITAREEVASPPRPGLFSRIVSFILSLFDEG